METIGFSTGSLARSEFRAALDVLSEHPVGAVELSALRSHELRPLLAALPHLDLSRYSHVSIHAPSASTADEEREIAALLAPWAADGWTIVVHPDVIRDFHPWAEFGAGLSIENMDVRKPCGRSTDELEAIFARLPDASFCFDIAHAWQFDPSMREAARLFDVFGDRLSHVHLSELDARSRHVRLSDAGVRAFQPLASLISPDVPVIIESAVNAWEVTSELGMCLMAMGRELAVV
jgi:sugar phosphate isomerase/epimerase